MELLFAFRIAVAMVADTVEAGGVRRRASYIFPEVLAQRAGGCWVFDVESVDFFPWLVQAEVFPEQTIHHKRRLFKWFVEKLYSNLFYLHLVSLKPLLPALLALF